MPRPPNILMLMSDEHRADVAGFGGDEVVRTPTLDHLAATGVVFRNCYTPSPICIPGRQAMMAGQFPRTCGVERFGEDLPPGSMTFARRLAQFGYMTACCGKLHHTGTDQMQGWTQRLAGDMAVTERHQKGRDEEACGRYPLRGPRWKWDDLGEVLRARPDQESRNQRFDDRATQAAEDFLEDYFVDMTRDRATPDRPLLLKVSLLQPHYPYITQRQRLLYYFHRVRPFLNEPVFEHPFLSERAVAVGEAATPREIRRATAAYYGMVEAVDAHFARVLDQLRLVGQDPDDWLILYTSDHGEMLGEHGIWEKQKFFEASARVPLIIRPPRSMRRQEASAAVVEENVNLCDLFATLCEVADVPLPPPGETVQGRGLDSRSLVPLLWGDAEAWQGRHTDESVSQFGGTNLMIKRGTLKYQWYGRPKCTGQREVLFDLAADPAERRNLINESTYSAMLPELRARRDELGFGPSSGDA